MILVKFEDANGNTNLEPLRSVCLRGNGMMPCLINGHEVYDVQVTAIFDMLDTFNCGPRPAHPAGIILDATTGSASYL